MAYGSTLRRGTRFTGGTPNSTNTRLATSQYSPSQTAVWRHQEVRATPSTGTASSLAGNNYLSQAMIRTQMSFDTSPDTPPTPTVSNNYVTTACFNGSRIEDFSAIIRIKNNDTVVRYLDLYEVTLSYLDGYNWESVMQSGGYQVPITQIVDSSVNAGQTNVIASTTGRIDASNYMAFLTHQKFMKKIGTIELGSAGSGENTIALEYNEVPAKCRRANYGMLWALFFHNDLLKNGTPPINLSYNKDSSFNEIPSDFRVPFVQ